MPNPTRNSAMAGCQPLAPPAGNVFMPVTAQVTELQSISSEDYRGVTILLKARIGPTQLSGTDSFRVPTTHKFALEGIGVEVRLHDYAAEFRLLNNDNDNVRGLGDALTVYDRQRLKASNCVFNLFNTDREEAFTFYGRPSLDMLLRNPLDYSATPHMVVPGETLRVDFSLESTDPKMVGGDTTYGILLTGKLIRVKAS